MKIYKALIDLENQCPELFYLMKNCKIEILPKEKCPTAYATKVKNGFKIAINEEWEEAFSVRDLSAIIEHELLHIVLDHCSSMPDYADKRLANIAMDSIINDIGHFFQDRKTLCKELQNGIYLDSLNAKYGTSFNSNRDSSKDIYNFLNDEKNEEKNKDLKSFDEGLGDETQGQGQDLGQETENALNGLGEELGPGQSHIDLDDILAPSELESLIKAYSKKSSDIAKHFGEIEKRARNKAINNAIERFFSSNKSESKRSIKKINKRFSFLPYGKTKDKKQKVLLALDVSGSMLNPEDLAKMRQTVLSATNNGYSVDLIFGDTKKIGEFFDIKKSFDFNQIKGGGGTELGFIFKQKNINDYDCIVCITDGEFDHSYVPKKRKNSILFLITNSYRKVRIEGFKNIEI